MLWVHSKFQSPFHICPHLYTSTKTHIYTLQCYCFHTSEPASVLGWCPCGNAGLAHVVLPWPANSAAERDSDRHPNFCQFLYCYVHEVWCAAGGPGTPQHHDAEPCQYICWWDTRSVKEPSKGSKVTGLNMDIIIPISRPDESAWKV